MEIKKFISMVLDELQDLKTSDEKKHYLIQDLEFELGLVINSDVSGEISGSKNILGVIKVGMALKGDASKENIQKVKIKMRPRNLNNKINN
jgi:hypothetical protein